MAERVPPSERTKEALHRLLTEGTDRDLKSELMTLSTRHITCQRPVLFRSRVCGSSVLTSPGAPILKS
jgi:hypothetical protein